MTEATTRIARLVFLGAPGAGKGTQAKVLEERFGIPQISTGDLLRRNVAEGSELGRIAAPIMAAGDLVPDDLMIAMVERELETTKAFVLDGFPRTVAQARALDAMLEKLSLPLTGIVLFDADRSSLIARLTGRWSNPRTGRTYHAVFNPPRVAGIDDDDGLPLVQRADDSPAVVTERLATYDAKTLPLVEYYRASGNLVRVDGLQPIGDVTEAILGAIDPEATGG